MELKKKKQHSSRRKIGRWWEFVIREGLCRANIYAESFRREGASQTKENGKTLAGRRNNICGDPEARKIRVFEEQQESYVWLESSQRRGSGRRGRMGRKEFW